MSENHTPPEPAGHGLPHIVGGPGPAENLAEHLSSLALVAMILLIGAEAIVRNVLGTSLQITDEICGYLLVAMTFLSMSVSEAHGAFHRVELVQARMGLRARLWMQLAFDACSLVASVLVAWQLGRMATNSWRNEDVAPTPLQTALWIPQSVLVLGMALLCLALLRSMAAKWRELRKARATHEGAPA